LVQVQALDDDTTASGRKRKPTAAKRRKVNHACLYCRRSHMTCDEGRPCQRWSAPTLFGFLEVGTDSRIVLLPASRGRLHISATTSKNLRLLRRRRLHPPLLQLPLLHRLLHPSPSPKLSPTQRCPHPSSQSTHSHVSDSHGRVHDVYSSYPTAIAVPFASTSTRTPALTWQSAGMPQAALFYPPETTLGSEFSALSDFLESR
jgi:hypothetical protein